MSKIFQILDELSKINLISGMECTSSTKQVPELFKKFGAFSDEFGNLWIQKKSEKNNAKNILIEAHLDTIGLCVKEIKSEGFLSVSSCGGVDAGILPGTEFNVYSDKTYKAVATSIPPHLLKNKSKEKLTLADIYLDCGFASKKEAEKHIKIGSPISFSAPCIKLLGDKICAPFLDNKAAVITLLLASSKVKSPHNLYFFFSLGEETTSRGVKTAKLPAKFDVALVTDAGFAFSKGLDKNKCIFMDAGPSVSIADTLSRDVASWIMDIAEKEALQHQIIVEPGGTGTSATAIQMRAEGIPCGLISIPIKYMHTQSEMVSERDIELTCELLCELLKQNIIPFEEVNVVG